MIEKRTLLHVAAVTALLSLSPVSTLSQVPPEAIALSAPGSPKATFPWSRSRLQDTRGFYYAPAGLCDDFPEQDRTEERLRRDFDAMRDTGAMLFRCGIPWGDIEREQGKYDWRFWDRLVATADRRHVALIPYVCYAPSWAAAAGDYRGPLRSPDLFGDFMRKIASRYRGRVRAWELWNEPDNPAFWMGTVNEFAELVKAGSKGVRSADPAATVVLGGVAGRAVPFFRDLASRADVRQAVDVVNMHDYAETWDQNPIESYPREIDGMAKVIADNRWPADLWMAEFGYSSARYSARKASEWGADAVYNYEHTPVYQAAVLLKTHILALATGRLSLTAWYRINDLTPGTAVIGDDANRHLGILTVDGKPKPAYHALRFFNRLFNGPVRLFSEIEVGTPANSQSVVRAFEKKNGDVILAAWLRTTLPSEVADQSGMAPDTRQETLSVTVPGRAVEQSTAFDAQGRPANTGAVANGRMDGLVLRGGQVIVVVLKTRHLTARGRPDSQ